MLDFDEAAAFDRQVTHHASYADLVESANGGCELCQRIRDGHEEKVARSKDPELDLDGDDTQITCTFNRLGQFLLWEQRQQKHGIEVSMDVCTEAGTYMYT